MTDNEDKPGVVNRTFGNRTLKQSNKIEHCMQQSNIKPVSSGFKQRGHPALKVTDDGRGQLRHLQRELVPVLACFPVLIVNLSILNHLTNKDFS